MKAAYLIKKDHVKALRSKVKNIPRVTMKSRIYGEKKHELHVVSLSTEKNGIADAHALAKARDCFADPKLTIYDEGNLYYVRQLFNQLSVLEQKLRGVVRLRLILSEASNVEVVAGLESQTFGDYCTMFFGDPKFSQQAKNVAGKREQYFHEKAYLIEQIDSIESECLWDKHFKPNEMPTFRQQHHDIRDIRNGAMHIHLISKEQYTKATNLLRKACKELDDFISSLLIDAPEDSASFATDFSESLNIYLKLSTELLGATKQLISDTIMTTSISEISRRYSELIDIDKQTLDSAMQDAFNLGALHEKINFSSLYKNTFDLASLSEAFRLPNTNIQENSTSPEGESSDDDNSDTRNPEND